MSSAQFDDKTTVSQGGPLGDSQATLVAGTDGSVVLPLRTDATGILQVNLATPTISVTGINASVGTTAATPPVFTTQVGGTDGVVLRELHLTPPSGVAPSTDPALIVTFSPNSPLPAGSNVIGTVTANLGTSGDLALDATLTDGTQTSQLTDGTNAVAVATGAAGAGSNALVVGLSPNSPLPAGTNDIGSVTANIGTTNGLALNSTLTDRSQHTKITNGTFDVAVKGGSTAAGAADSSFVVAVSPNSPLPSGTNSIGAVTQSVASNLLSEVSQPTASALNATVVQATAGNLNATAVQGTAAILSGAWPVKVTDGTNTQPTGDVAGRAIFHKVTDGTNVAGVKAASTAAQVTDPALVVGLSPNSPLPSGSNTIGTVLLSGGDNTNGLIATAIKPVVSAAYSWTRFQNLGANVTLNVKASAGNVFSVYCQNNAGTNRYLQLFNTATTPAPGAVPLFTFLVIKAEDILIDGSFFGTNGHYFSTGIAFAFSTTQATYTAASAADHATHIMYI